MAVSGSRSNQYPRINHPLLLDLYVLHRSLREIDYALRITGLVANPQTYSYDEVVGDFKPHKKVVRLDCVEGLSVTIFWEGVLVKDLIKEEANPEANATVVIFRAYDGLPRLSPLITSWTMTSSWHTR